MIAIGNNFMCYFFHFQFVEGTNCSYNELKRLEFKMAVGDVAAASLTEATTSLRNITNSRRGSSLYASWIINILACKLTDEELGFVFNTTGINLTKTCCIDM